MAAENNEAVSEALDVVKVFSADKDVREQARREMLAEMVSDATLFQSVIFRLFNLKITDFFYL